MKNKFYTMALFIAILFFCSFAYCFAQAGNYHGICAHVIDGDTVDIVDENQSLHRIRITGMDAPELSQPYGLQAKKVLKDLILNHEVLVLPMGIDKYNRELACLRINATIGQIDVAEAMINKGAAFDWGGKYYKAQAYAQEFRLGVWSDKKYQERPWLYRHRIQ